MNYKARILMALALAFTAPITFWLGGFEFERGPVLATVFLMALLAASWGFACPLFDKDKDL